MEKIFIKVHQSLISETTDTVCTWQVTKYLQFIFFVYLHFHKVEHIIREDYLGEAMEMLELYCDLLLARFGLIETQQWVKFHSSFIVGGATCSNFIH